VIDGQAALGHRFLQIAIAEWVLEVPEYAQNDDLVRKYRRRNNGGRLSRIRFNLTIRI